ncbi:glycosyltransferase [Arthrobacter sp. 24S4-2]|uniref:glycosyltransferase n=1 Tax=Arthrobacter sp. 24S4-2 TaxID=2575374 RepID=UPI001586EA48|nr:glycosyltransferase [Arthrobacter sp. 24S4-2]
MIENPMSQSRAEQEQNAANPVSVICVFNNPSVLAECLHASVKAGIAEAPGTEFIPVDNTSSQFSSAGAALNYGASLAGNDVLVFVHQDVYLHSLPALEASAAILMDDPSVGLLGAVGVTHGGQVMGLIRDRIVFSGERRSGLSDVDSLDEVLFMARKEQISAHPLAEDPELSWHAYAVEYGVRMRSLGLRVVVADVPLTHNSLTINLDRLAEAHAWIAAAYPEQMPIVTTCGTVHVPTRARTIPLFGRLFEIHKWRYRWLVESLAAHRLRKNAKAVTVLGDIRRDIDEICSAAGLDSALVISAIPSGLEATPVARPLELNRREVRFRFHSALAPDLPSLLRSFPADESIALTNIGFGGAGDIAEALADRQIIVGFHGNTGPWMLIGPAVAAAIPYYRTRHSTPFAMKAS